MKPAPSGEDVIKLYTHNARVDDINTTELNKLKTETKTYHMTSRGRQSAVESLINRCLAPEQLLLKVNSEVMFVANNPAKQFYNGTLGKVVKFNADNQPVIQTKHSLITVDEHTWENTRTVLQQIISL